jgi:hypothetical protein
MITVYFYAQITQMFQHLISKLCLWYLDYIKFATHNLKFHAVAMFTILIHVKFALYKIPQYVHYKTEHIIPRLAHGSSSSSKHYSLLSLKQSLCDLFNDAISSLDCIALNDRMINE